MAFFQKTDYCGLGEIFATLRVKDDSENASQEKYQPQGQDGSFIATEIYGEDSAPANNYGVAGNVSATAGQVSLGHITTIQTKRYALESITINTAAGSAPTVAATCQQIEGAIAGGTQCKYAVPAFTLTTKQHAQVLFNAFALSGNGCVLTDCNASINCTVNKEKVAGVNIASDINSGIITVTGTVLQTNVANTQTPTISAASGWTLTQKPNCSNPETGYKTYSFELQKALVKS